MLHEPAAQSEKDYGIDYKMRLGVIMFIIYAVVYAGFVAISVIHVKWMEITIVLGLNLASVYGFGLIVFALLLALIYNQACGSKEASLKALDSANGEGQ